MKMAMLLGFAVLFAGALNAQAACIEGKFSVPMSYDDNGRFASAIFQFKLVEPTESTAGQFTSTLENGSDSYIVANNRTGKPITTVAQAITPDDVAMVQSPFRPRCPCTVSVSEDGKISIAIETDGGGNLTARFDRYFNIRDAGTAITFSDLKNCQ